MPQSSRSSVVLWSASVLAIAGLAVQAEGPFDRVVGGRPTPREAAATVTRMYDVSDLVHPPAGGKGDNGGSYSFDALRAFVQAQADPGSWKDAGGDVGSISTVADLLVVTQTEAGQRAVGELLAAVRQASSAGAVVRVDAQWLLLTPAELAAGRDGPPPSLAADPAALYCQARTVGFNGQTVTASAQRTSATVTDVTPVVAPNAVAYNLTMGTSQTGVTLTVTPRVAAGNVTVDVSSTVTADLPHAPIAGATTEPTDPYRGMVMRPDRLEQQFQTSVRLRPDAPTVVGGMTGQPGGAGERRSLCLVLTAHVDDAAVATTRPAAR